MTIPPVSKSQWQDAKAHAGIPRSIGGGVFIASNHEGDFQAVQWGKRARKNLKRVLSVKTFAR